MEPSEPELGILLGWIAHDAGANIMLKMQSSSKVPDGEEDVQEFRYFLTKQQAVQLGNFLFKMAGETAPERHKPRLLDRLMGR